MYIRIYIINAVRNQSLQRVSAKVTQHLCSVAPIRRFHLRMEAHKEFAIVAVGWNSCDLPASYLPINKYST